MAGDACSRTAPLHLAQTNRLTPKADVFAFGVLLYEILTRRLVTFYDDSEQAQAYERSV